MDTPVLVIKFGHESYVQWPNYGYDGDRLVVNGARAQQRAVGDASFIVVEGDVTALAVYVPPSTVTTKYTLRPDLICAAKSAWVTPAEYERLPEADRGLYAAVTEQREQRVRPVAFRVVDGRAKPRKLPAGIVPILPAHVNTYPWFWWTLPCTATVDYVFGQLTERVKALDPNQFDVTVYTNIKHIAVTARSFSLGGAIYKPEGYLLRIDRDEKTVPAFSGTDLDDVVKKTSVWCDERMKPFTAALSLSACPCCTTKLKGKRARIIASDSRYRTGHKID